MSDEPEKPKADDPKKPTGVAHPGMMGDGTEEQNLDETGDPKARISEDDVKAAFDKPPAKTLRLQPFVAFKSQKIFMQIPLQVTFEGTDPSDAARFLIEQEVERLESHNQRITGCRVKVIAPSHKHRHGTSFEVHIWMTLPPHESIVVGDKSGDDNAHESAASAIKHTFVLATRQLDAFTHRA